MSEDYLEEEKERGEVLVRPTRELENFLKIVDKASKFVKSQISGIIYMSPKPRWFMFKAIEVIESWREAKNRCKGKNYEECFYRVTQSITGLDFGRQIKVLIKALALLEYLFRTSPTSINVIKTGFVWFMTQGKVELVYQLQGWLQQKLPSLKQLRVGEEG